MNFAVERTAPDAIYLLHVKQSLFRGAEISDQKIADRRIDIT